MLMRTGQLMSVKTHKKSDAPAIFAGLTALAGNQLESPGFAPSAMLCAILANLEGGILTTVEDAAGMTALLALRRRQFPLPSDESWITPLTSSGLPILDHSAAPVAVAAIVASLKRPLILREIPEQSKAHQLLRDHGNQIEILNGWQRACLKTEGSFATWMETNFDHKRRKELKRLRARLSEKGEVEFQSLAADAHPETFISDFLRLEASGWKAQKGTALAQSKPLERALRQGLAALHKSGSLRFWRIVKAGQPIAALFAIVENGQATLGKIAYDESFAKYSPGVLLILEATEHFFQSPDITFADSNAVPDHPMINRIWRDRMTVVDLMIAPPNMSSARFELSVCAEKYRNALRLLAKTTYQKIRRR
jgi:CelD/BcsL family acetyltransferase involved in cellulose biosynthesis